MKENFVPVVIDGYLPGNSSEAEFCKQVCEGVNSFSFASASGKKLGSNTCDDMTGGLKEAVRTFRGLSEAERKPKLEKPGPLSYEQVTRTPPPGGLIARVYSTFLDRDDRGTIARARKGAYNLHDGVPTVEAEPALVWHDAFWMTAEEVRSMVPENVEKGKRYPVPAAVRRRIFTYHIAETPYPPFRHKPRSGELTLMAEKVSADRVEFRLDGFVIRGADFDASNPRQGYHTGTTGWRPGFEDAAEFFGNRHRLLGFLTYDRKKQAFERFGIVVVGETWGWISEGLRGAISGAWNGGKLEGYDPSKRRRCPMGIAFELVSGDRPADRFQPKYAARYGYGETYFQGTE